MSFKDLSQSKSTEETTFMSFAEGREGQIVRGLGMLDRCCVSLCLIEGDLGRDDHFQLGLVVLWLDLLLVMNGLGDRKLWC